MTYRSKMDLDWSKKSNYRDIPVRLILYFLKTKKRKILFGRIMVLFLLMQCIFNYQGKVISFYVCNLQKFRMMVMKTNLRVCLKHRNFTGITQKFHRNQFNFTEKRRKRKKKILCSKQGLHLLQATGLAQLFIHLKYTIYVEFPIARLCFSLRKGCQLSPLH